MAYFPMFVELEGRPCLIVGGGAVALRKARKLLPYGPELTVVAPEPIPALTALPVTAFAQAAEQEVNASLQETTVSGIANDITR